MGQSVCNIHYFYSNKRIFEKLHGKKNKSDRQLKNLTHLHNKLGILIRSIDFYYLWFWVAYIGTRLFSHFFILISSYDLGILTSTLVLNIWTLEMYTWHEKTFSCSYWMHLTVDRFPKPTLALPIKTLVYSSLLVQMSAILSILWPPNLKGWIHCLSSFFLLIVAT